MKLGWKRTPEESLKALERHIEVDTVVDIGVADGTPFLYNSFSPKKYKYVLIEPNTAYLEACFRIAGSMPWAHFYPVFCGQVDGHETFYDVGDAGKASKYPRKGATPKKGTVMSAKLDTMLSEHDGPYLLKIDVEGAEMDVLKGAEETLEYTKAIVIEAPLNPKPNASSFGEIFDYLHHKGFKVWDIIDLSYKGDKLNLCNLVFVA